MHKDSNSLNGPEGGFTQRSTFDPSTNEVFLLSGLMREKASNVDTAKNSFWCLNLNNFQWSRIYNNENVDSEYWNRNRNLEPCPRYAHQFVYDCETKVHYLFGGNPGDQMQPRSRLDDLWELRLERPTAEDIKKRLKFLLRKQKYLELCLSDPPSALKYLQTQVSRVVNHQSEEESKEFRNLATCLFTSNTFNQENVLVKSKEEFYEDIVEYFPFSMKPPKTNLLDLVIK
jgi:hypothetical protein